MSSLPAQQQSCAPQGLSACACPCLQFRRAFQRNDKPIVMGCLKFIAHLINQQVAHEVLGLQILMMLLDPPTDDGVEAVLQFLADVGATLQEFSSAALRGWVRAEGSVWGGMLIRATWWWGATA